MSVAILLMGWVTASLTVRVGLICWDNGQVGKTQGPSTSLRSGRDDKVWGFAPVEMTEFG